MTRDDLAPIIEAILMTSHEPVQTEQMLKALQPDGATVDDIEAVLASLQREYASPGRGIRLERAAGGWRIVTASGLDTYLRAFHGAASRQKLSQAALEVLAIAAYRQPVTLPEISFIRGVNSAGVLRTLLDRKLLQVAGRKKVVGKPFLYRTTREFLIHFGLDRPEDLPELDEITREASSFSPNGG